MITLKNKLLKLIMTGLLVLTTVAFISCGETPADDDNSGENTEETNTENDSGEIITAEESTNKLKALGDYDIVAEVVIIDGETISMELAKKGNIYWFSSYGVSTAYQLSDDTFYSYMGTEDDSGTMTWMQMGSEKSDKLADTLKEMDEKFENSLFCAEGLADGCTKSGSETIAGRKCTKYTWADSASYGDTTVSAEKYVYIDDETGICMKMVASESSNGESSTGSFEVKKFLTGSAVIAPNLSN